jgi:hypothetical protein
MEQLFLCDKAGVTAAGLNDTIKWTASCKGKGKIHPRRGHQDPDGEYWYSPTVYSSLTLDWCGRSKPRLGRFTPEKESRYSLYRRLGGPQGRSGRVRKISSPLGFVYRTVQPVASRYTYYVIPAHGQPPVLAKGLSSSIWHHEYHRMYSYICAKHWVLTSGVLADLMPSSFWRQFMKYVKITAIAS